MIQGATEGHAKTGSALVTRSVKARLGGARAAIVLSVLCVLPTGCDRPQDQSAPAASNTQNLASAEGELSRAKEQATGDLQRQLDAQFGSGKVKVSELTLIRTDANRYEGRAEVVTGGAKAFVPLKIVANGSTALVDIDASRLATLLESSKTNQLSSIVGQYSSAVLKQPYVSLLPMHALRQNYGLAKRLQVETPIRKVDGFYFGEGCAPHACGADAAAWQISENGKSSAVVVLKWEKANEVMEAHATYYVFGSSPEDLSGPLKKWAVENGMSNMNSVQITDDNA